MIEKTRFNRRDILKSLAAIAVGTAGLTLPSCETSSPRFDETGWENETRFADPSLLYAPHETNGVFFNPWRPMEHTGFHRVLEWKLFHERGKYTEYEESFLPLVNPGAVEMTGKTEGDIIVWIGHNTFLLRIDGGYWITDPIFSDRALLPKRYIPPALDATDIRGLTGRINIIITHNHYDHLDENSIRSLPSAGKTYVPLGLAPLLKEWGRIEVKEMDWWQEENEAGTTVVCLPAQHWSRRLTQGMNTTLWAGFIIITKKYRLFLAGDSGYFHGYRETGRRYPGIDYALIPIGTYHPRWFMHYAHMNVNEALQAFDDLGARYFIPAHWGTFRLSDEPPGHPILDLERSIKKSGRDISRFIISGPGYIIPMRTGE